MDYERRDAMLNVAFGKAVSEPTTEAGRKFAAFLSREPDAWPGWGDVQAILAIEAEAHAAGRAEEETACGERGHLTAHDLRKMLDNAEAAGRAKALREVRKRIEALTVSNTYLHDPDNAGGIHGANALDRTAVLAALTTETKGDGA